MRVVDPMDVDTPPLADVGNEDVILRGRPVAEPEVFNVGHSALSPQEPANG